MIWYPSSKRSTAGSISMATPKGTGSACHPRRQVFRGPLHPFQRVHTQPPNVSHGRRGAKAAIAKHTSSPADDFSHITNKDNEIRSFVKYSKNHSSGYIKYTTMYSRYFRDRDDGWEYSARVETPSLNIQLLSKFEQTRHSAESRNPGFFMLTQQFKNQDTGSRLPRDDELRARTRGLG